MDDFDERVRQRAYRLWVEEGCPEGRSDVHWDKARELVAVEDNQKLATKTAPRDHEVGEPVEPMEAVENTGEFPTMADHGEEQAAPRRRASTPQASSRTKPAAAAKPPKAPPAKRR